MIRINLAAKIKNLLLSILDLPKKPSEAMPRTLRICPLSRRKDTLLHLALELIPDAERQACDRIHVYTSDLTHPEQSFRVNELHWYQRRAIRLEEYLEDIKVAEKTRGRPVRGQRLDKVLSYLSTT